MVELAPWHETFVGNLKDLITRGSPPPLPHASEPGIFWADVFVTSRPNWRRFLESLAGHLLALGLIPALLPLWPHSSRISLHPFHRPEVLTYQTAAYLPALDTGGPKKRSAAKGHPQHAPQTILSVTPEADNHSQTIVVAPKLKLNRELELPNVIVASSALVAVPIAATSGALSDRRPDLSQPTVVAPQPQMDPPSSRRVAGLEPLNPEIVAPAPKLTLDRQEARAPNLGNRGAAVVPPPPALTSAPQAKPGSTLIALGLHPLAPGKPIEAPPGNRRGDFSATSSGKPTANGQPDQATEKRAGGMAKPLRGLPSGLEVAGGPQPSNRGSGRQGTAELATLRSNSLPAPHSSRPSPAATELEKQVFGDRKFYAMVLNMPNLNSSGGSWVIHFAEFKHAPDKGDLSTPVPTKEVDPGYPAELMRHNVQGTVTLYAVIHSDGSVDGVRVLQGVDDRLDDYARAALSHWRFRPATKNGNAVDLEAVVVIPFRAGAGKPNF